MKLIFASVIVLFGVVFFLFALFPSDMSVSRVIRINAPRDVVYREIADLRNWEKWNQLIRIPPGRENQEPAFLTDSSRIRKRNLSISLVRKTADSIITKWQNDSGKSFVGEYSLSGDDGQVVLQWVLKFHLHWYPWEKLSSMFYEKHLGPLMDQSLANLKKELEGS